ncbi:MULTISPECIES: DUF3310 domain-containing protein [Streptomyces]|uniref:DUF3310 domain-containing protein n=1 Tax=Streptomyces TaxID=1883 RepID=UPI001E2E1026|nr:MULTISPECIES: DUF3310 domain-containing protein [Streptomyces]UFQ16392.1 DUF3310 domain-containing protein [Streptomyces huasconensis]WCL85995.1 DUF3310 domain-containing protein [Streptomyces sp. JCM 35825]
MHVVNGQLATFLYNQRVGELTNIYEGGPYPYEVQFEKVGRLCFAADELEHYKPLTPGRRLLNETKGLAYGVNAQEAQKVMKAAFTSAQKVDRGNTAVEHPSHYTSHPSGVECIEITKHMNFALGNAIKYLWRAGLKGDAIQDLEKARQYIDIEIQRLKETA